MPRVKRVPATAFPTTPLPSSQTVRTWVLVAAGISALICGACLIGFFAIAPHWISPKQLLTFGTEGKDPGMLYHATYIGLDAQGNIYIADWNTGHINEFDPQGKFLKLTQLGDGVTLLGMAVAPDGSLYLSHDGDIHHLLADGTDTTIEVKDSNGDRAALITGIALGPDGGLAASDQDGDILRFTWRGEPTVVLPKAFDLPSFSSQNELHSGDAPILSYDVPANSADKEVSVAVDGSGNIYVVGWTIGVVMKTDSQGGSLSKFGTWATFPGGWERGKFDFPDALAIDSSGRIYVADSSGVQIFGPDEKYLYTIRVNNGVDALALDPQGNIYTVSYPAVVTKFEALQP